MGMLRQVTNIMVRTRNSQHVVMQESHRTQRLNGAKPQAIKEVSCLMQESIL